MPITEGTGKDPEKLPVMLLSPADGWHFVSDHPQLHYFFKEASLCRKYPTKPEDARHRNIPLLHCNKCTQTLKKLLGVQNHIAGKKLDAKQVFDLLEILDKIKMNRGLADKELTSEHVVVVLGHKDGTKTTMETGINSNDEKKDVKK